MNIFERAIFFFSPSAAVRRSQARAAIAMLEKHSRKFDAGKHGNRTKGWKASNSSANADTRTSISTLRARSIDMYQNNGHLRSLIQKLTTNIVGAGVRPSVEFPSSKAFEKKLLKSWRKWAESETSDFDGRMDFYAMQALVVRNVIMSGECIIRRRRDVSTGLPLQLQVQEGHVLDHSKDGYVMENGDYIVMGVEFSKAGKRIAYWLFDEHPGDMSLRSGLVSRRIPANDVCHVYFVERPGQVRGVPWTVASMLKLRDLDQYEDAQIIRQKVAACFTAFVSDSSDTSIGDSTTKLDYDALEPGRIEELPIGKQITFSTPPPAEGYDTFTKGVLRSASAGGGITYEAMTNDYSQVNFSSGRMGWIEMHRQIMEWTISMVKPMCNTVWGWFMEACGIAGVVRSTQVETMASWTPPRREMLDPVKEAKGIVELLKANLISYSEALRKAGYEPDDVIEEMASDIKKLDEVGIIPNWDGRLLKTKAEGSGKSLPTNSDG